MKTPNPVKNFRKALASRFLIMPLVLVILIFSIMSCQQHAESPKISYTGEQLFKGIFFMQGELANRITLFNKIKGAYDFESDPEVMVQYNNILEEVIIVMKKQSPNFFKQFKSSIESGDHFQVKDILSKGTDLLYASLFKVSIIADYYQEALNLSSQINTDGLIDDDGSVNISKMKEIDDLIKEKSRDGKSFSSRTEACSLIAVCVVWIYLGVVQSAAVGVSVVAVAAVAIYAGVWFWVAAPELQERVSGQQTLQQELLINEIALKFATN